MPDVQIHPTGVVAAPGDYIIPDSAELLLKNAFASFDGSGAAGDFRPLLRIKSDAGTTLIEAVADTTVVAGASADCSWFPHVAAGSGAATATAAEWFQGTHLTRFQVGGLDTNEIPWTAHQTSDASLFTLVNTFGANTVIRVNRPGVTLMSVSASQDEVANWQGSVGCFSVTDAQLGSYGDNYLTDTGALGTPAGQSDVMRDYRISVGTASPFDLFCKFANYDGVARGIISVTVGVVWWPNTTLAV